MSTHFARRAHHRCSRPFEVMAVAASRPGRSQCMTPSVKCRGSAKRLSSVHAPAASSCGGVGVGKVEGGKEVGGEGLDEQGGRQGRAGWGAGGQGD